ncbi:MAG: hypothetical protein FWC01_02405 [Treponema sp.]|nr:hypothetical protein [Treponema sp.]MCL2237120.1 hypothetical protein [Treponema sp.]
MIRSLILTGVFFIFVSSLFVDAQDQRPAGSEGTPGNRRRMPPLVMEIEARVLNNEREIVWSQSQTRAAIMGSPVRIRLDGSNIVVALQFTAFVRRQSSVLAAQGQIWIEDANGAINYYTSMQTIPMEYNEPIYFYPLGTSAQLDSTIVIIITVNQNRENTVVTENEN